MKSEVISVKCSIVRGGTSKGIFILENELPSDPVLRDKYVLEIFGSPDVRQIDGLGGADVLTSKLAIVGPSSREDADVDYTFGQVSFVDAKVDYKSNCGNISAGVGPFAIDNGLVKAVEPYTTVRIHQVNTDSIINAKVEVKDGRAVIEGGLHIDGVPALGSTVELDFSDSVKEELRGMVGRVEELYILTKEAIVEKDARLLPRIDRVEDQVDGLRKRLIDSHIQRLNQGACKAESSGVFINLVSNLERLGDHLTYIAHTVEEY